MPPALLFVAPLATAPSPQPQWSIPATVVAALIGAVVAVLGFIINDAFARYRARAEWTREQLYATTKQLQEHHRHIVREVLNAPRLPEESMFVRDAQKFIDSHAWIRLEEAVEGYRAGLDEIGLLLREPEVRQQAAHVDVTMREIRTAMLSPYGSYEPLAVIQAQNFDFRMFHHKYRLDAAHEALIKTVTHRHFVGWRSRWTERYRDFKDRRQNRKMDRRASA